VQNARFLMVKLWWIAGETLVSLRSLFVLEKDASFSGFIFEGFPLWECMTCDDLFVLPEFHQR
jgi:hypothetical protein